MFRSKEVGEAFAVAIARIEEGIRVKVSKENGFWFVRCI